MARKKTTATKSAMAAVLEKATEVVTAKVMAKQISMSTPATAAMVSQRAP